MLHACGLQKMEHIGQRKAVLVTERNVQAVISSGSLQFEIERAAESFSQRQSPSFVDSAAQWRVKDELHSPAFVEKTFRDYRVLRWNGPQYRAASHDIFHGLFGAGLIESALLLQPPHGGHGLR